MRLQRALNLFPGGSAPSWNLSAHADARSRRGPSMPKSSILVSVLVGGTGARTTCGIAPVCDYPHNIGNPVLGLESVSASAIAPSRLPREIEEGFPPFGREAATRRASDAVT